MAISTGYAVADVQALSAIKPEERADGLMLVVKSDNNVGYASIYVYADGDSSNADLDIVVMPDDAPPKGRWIKTGWGDVVINTSPPTRTPVQRYLFYIEDNTANRKIYVSRAEERLEDWHLISSLGWTVQSTLPYTSKPGDSIAIIVDGTQGTVLLPAFPEPGYSVNLINVVDNTTLIIDPNGANYNGVVNRTIILNQARAQITFIFASPDIGWISTLDAALTISP